MGSVQIIINQSGKPAGIAGESRDDLSTSVAVVLTNGDNSGVSLFRWQMLDKPSGSSAMLATPSSNETSFIPDKEGSYLIRLTINGNIFGTAIAAIKDALGIRIPAAGETDELDGWQEALKVSVETLSASAGGTGIHTIGGSSHSQSTLAELNSKISDAVLDGSTASRSPTGTAGGDLSGTYPDPTVDGLQGRTVDSATPSSSDVLAWDGSKWTPTSPGAPSAHALGGSSHTADTLASLNSKITDANLDDSSASRAPSGSATGDLSGSYPNPTVDGLQGRTVSSAAPTPGQGLVWSGTQWAPADVPPAGSASGDLSGTYPGPTVAKIQGRSVSASVPYAGYHLKYSGTVWFPSDGVEGSSFGFTSDQNMAIIIPPESGVPYDNIDGTPEWHFRCGLTSESFWSSNETNAYLAFSTFIPQGVKIQSVIADVDPATGGTQMRMYVSRLSKNIPLDASAAVSVSMNSGYTNVQSSGGGRGPLVFSCNQNNSNWNSSQTSGSTLQRIFIMFQSNQDFTADYVYGVYLDCKVAGISSRIAPNAS